MSCTTSSASAGLRVMRSAAAYRLGSSGSTSRSKRSRRAGSSAAAVWAMGGQYRASSTGPTVPMGERADRRRHRAPTVERLAYLGDDGRIGARCPTTTIVPRSPAAAAATAPAAAGAPRPRFAPWLIVPILLVALLVFNNVLSSTQRASRSPTASSSTAVEDGRIDPETTGEDLRLAASPARCRPTRARRTSRRRCRPTSDRRRVPRRSWTRTTSTTSSSSRACSLSLLVNILPFALIMIGIYWFVFRRMGAGASGALNMGKNKVKIYDRKEMKTTFADVAGVDEAKDELREIVEFLSNPKKYQRLGGRIPKGVLLLGPPGCGKTLLARAVAGEANVPFFFMSGSEFVEMFVGLGAARVRELFQQAKEKAPALVFLDEIDTIGKGRGGVSGAGPRRARRARADAQPAARRDGRLRRLEGRHHHGRHEPPRRARPRARPPRPLRPPGRRRPPRPEGPRGDPARARPRRGARRPTSSCARSRRAPPASRAPTSRTW